MIKSIVRLWTPPALISLLRDIRGYGWTGRYGSWDEASRRCTGYDNTLILEKVRKALIKVRDGVSAYERDSVNFDTIQYSWPLLACLERSALSNGGNLSVLDFGGSLGSSYYQNMGFLSSLKHLEWSIVEQPHFVDCGKKDFEDDKLKFYHTIGECMEQRRPSVLLLSSVLQYLEEPYAWLEEFFKHGFSTIILDRTPVMPMEKDFITVQRVPPTIYKASYPSWIFSETALTSFFTPLYNQVAGFESVDKGTRPGMIFKGYIFERR